MCHIKLCRSAKPVQPVCRATSRLSDICLVTAPTRPKPATRGVFQPRGCRTHHQRPLELPNQVSSIITSLFLHSILSAICKASEPPAPTRLVQKGSSMADSSSQLIWRGLPDCRNECALDAQIESAGTHQDQRIKASICPFLPANMAEEESVLYNLLSFHKLHTKTLCHTGSHRRITRQGLAERLQS